MDPSHGAPRPRIYKVPELIAVARESGVVVGRNTVYGWLRSGELRGYRLRNGQSAWRIDERDWLAFLERHRRDAEAVAGS